MNNPRILLSNDDGINAPGLKVLQRIAGKLSDDVWVVAPETEQSGASHSLTLTEPLRLRRISRRKFAVRGTPTDCVMLAISEVVGGRRPDLLLSGVNRGANLGEDVTYSGTIAAAMEGTLLQIPSIALSQVFRSGGNPHWATAEHHAPALIAKLLDAGWAKDTLISVNFPDVVPGAVCGIKVASQGRRDISDSVIEKRIDTRGVPYFWIGFRRDESATDPKTDLGVVERHGIAVTPLHLDLAHRRSMSNLRKVLED